MTEMSKQLGYNLHVSSVFEEGWELGIGFRIGNTIQIALEVDVD